MPSEIIVGGIVSSIVGAIGATLRHRRQMRRDVELARIGREAAEAEAERCHQRVRDLEDLVLDLRARVAELEALVRLQTEPEPDLAD